MRFADSIRPPDNRPQRDPGQAALYSLFFPGAGHWYLGLKGLAVAHGVLNAWVIAAAVLGAIARSFAMAAIFAFAALALWLIAAHDAYREAARQRSSVILKGRVFLYVVLGLLFVMIGMLITTSLKADL